MNKEKRQVPLRWKRMWRQFKIFYSSWYGKAGVWILLAFVVITLLAPLATPNPNYNFIAPGVDTTIVDEINQHNLNVNRNITIYGPYSTDVNNEGTSAIYFGLSNGTFYYYSLGQEETGSHLGQYKIIYNANLTASEKMYCPIMVSYTNGTYYKDTFNGLSPNTRYSIERFVFLPLSNGKIVVGNIFYYSQQYFTPLFKVYENISYGGTFFKHSVSNGISINGLTVNYENPAFDYSSGVDLIPAQYFFITSNSTSYYLNGYNVSPLSKIFAPVKIDLTNIYNIEMFGSNLPPNQYYSDARILVYNKTSIESFYVNGTKAWQISGINLNPNETLYIPFDYQSNYKGNNQVYFINNTNEASTISMKNGTVLSFFKSTSQLTSVSTTPGSSGLPAYIVLMSDTKAYIFNLTISGEYEMKVTSLPVDSGLFYSPASYNIESNSLIFVSNKGEILSFALSFNSGGLSFNGSFLWTAHVTPVPSSTSVPISFSDRASGFSEISFVSNLGYIYIYNSNAKSVTPVPPMAKTASGTSLFLGTTYYGHDVWSWFMESFYNDWIFGLTIGLITIILSLLVSLYVGYKGGLVGAAIETASLSLYLIPGLALLIALASVIPGEANFADLIIIVSAISWPFSAFTLMGLVRGVASRSYVDASKIFGSNSTGIMRRHILPNLGPLLVYLLALSISGGVGAVSGLEFLGLAPLDVSTWGGMLNSVYSDYFYVATEPQWVWPPVIALTLFLVAFIFVSRALDEVVNPRLRKR